MEQSRSLAGTRMGKPTRWRTASAEQTWRFAGLEIDEGRDIAKYGKQIKELGDQPSVAILEEVIADEREHYLTLGNLIRSRGALPALPHLSRPRRLLTS